MTMTAIFVYNSSSLVGKSKPIYDVIYYCFCIFIQLSCGYRYTPPIITNTWQKSANVGQQPSCRTGSLMAIVRRRLDFFVVQFRQPTVVCVTGR